MPFEKSLLKIGQLTAKPTFNIHSPVGLRLLTRLQFKLSDINRHKFKHNFQNCVNLLWFCSFEIESLSHFFLHCHQIINICAAFLDDLQSVDINIPGFSSNEFMDLLFYESPNFNFIQNSNILSSSISFIIESERFSDLLFLKELKVY